MTEKNGKGLTITKRKASVGFLLPIFTLGMVLYALFLSDRLGAFVLEGLRLSVNCVLPTGFPFMLLCDIYMYISADAKPGLLSKLEGWLLGISPVHVPILICGWICGFPQGALVASDLYRNNRISKEECQRLIPLASLPSLPFVIGGVGIGMLGCKTYGIIIAISIISASLIAGIIIRRKQTEYSVSNFISRQSYSFVFSVKRAGSNFITVISFITIFAVIGGALDYIIPYEWMRGVVKIILEVTGGVKYLSTTQIGEHIRLGLCSIALSLGGISALMQSKALCLDTDLSFLPYPFIKILVAAISFCITLILCYIFL